MDPSGGYVRLYRKLLQNPVWTQLAPAVLKVAVYFLLRANYRPVQWYDGVGPVFIPAGSFITSYGKTAAACNLSIQQIRDAFAHLERTRFATYRRTRRWTLVTVLNYAIYQATADEENTAENTDGNTSGNRQGTTDKEVKKRRRKTCASQTDAQAFGEPSPLDGLPFDTLEADSSFPDSPEPERHPVAELRTKEPAWFGQWWAGYWLKKGRKQAEKAFQKHVRTEARFQRVMDATRAQAPEMLTRSSEHRPYGATWLNGERWEDEIERPPAAAPDDYPELPA
jgi:hypothetical protein